MTSLRLALAQINPVVGDFAGNIELIVSAVREARSSGAQLVAVGEMALPGYPVEDLVLRESFIAASRAELARLQQRLLDEQLDDVALIVGTLEADGPVLPQAMGYRGSGGARNSAVLLHRGRIAATHHKHHLPTHGVFDENRHFVPGNRLNVVSLDIEGTGTADADGRLSEENRTVNLSMLICADLWHDSGPLARCVGENIDVLVCINASPYEHHKDQARVAVCRRAAIRTGAIVAYVNLIGGQDELVFDGSSLVVHPDGRVLASAPSFVPHLTVLDLELPAHGIEFDAGDSMSSNEGSEELTITVAHSAATLRAVPRDTIVTPGGAVQLLPEPISDEQQTWQALALGPRDYVHKNGFSSVVLGLSGGIDSAVCATLACDALGSEQVHGVALPSAYSSQHSFDDARELAERTGLTLRVLPINSMVKTFGDELVLEGLAEQNLQARIRAVLLMGISNSEGHLLLSTGNKSESAVGYFTLYGDAAGGFAPLKDVYKTMVWRLAAWRNDLALHRGEQAPIPENSIAKPPSAELSLDQLDSDALPPYDVLDAILRLYIDLDWGREEIVAAGNSPDVVDQVLAMVTTSEYKRRQTPPGPKVSLKAFGRDRRMPVTHRFNG